MPSNHGRKTIYLLRFRWTLENETAAQIDRAEKAALVARDLGVQTTADLILQLQEEGAELQVREVFPYVLSQLGLGEIQQKIVLRKAWWDKTLLSLYPDTRMLLDKLSVVHFIGLIANQSPGTEKRLKSYGIRDHFNLVFASAEKGVSKPDSEIFRLSQERAGCSADDIMPAKKAEWKTIRILQDYNRKQRPNDRSEIPDYTISELSELLKILQ